MSIAYYVSLNDRIVFSSCIAKQDNDENTAYLIVKNNKQIIELNKDGESLKQGINTNPISST
ncbi:MAG: hypothetical protein ACTSQX_15220 [Candidatus Heimdallarchaeota archaeon]